MTDTSTDSTGAQTRFFPRPGAVSFKRLLGGCMVQTGYIGNTLDREHG